MTYTDTELAIAAADAGATVLRAMYGGALTRIDKTDFDFATTADIESERAIVSTIGESRPDDAVLGEETGHTGPASAHRTWLVDPLCGTLNYAAQTPLAAVNVALRHGSEITTAASADPFSAELFWTDGKHAFVRRGGDDTTLVPTARSRLVDVNLDPPYPNASRFRTVDLLTDPGFTSSFRPRVTSTSLALAWVAAGRRAAYITDGQVHDSVHFAAAIALCRAAGCIVTDLRGNPLGTTPTGLIAAADTPTRTTLTTLTKP